MTAWLRASFNRRLDRRAEVLAGRISPHLTPRSRIVDVGSGTGHNARALIRRLGASCLEVDVVDFHVVGEGPILFDGRRLPLADDAFDFALLIHVLTYVEDPASLLREASRTATRGVVLVQSTHDGRGGSIWLRGRGWLQGRVAFQVCRRLGLIPDVPAKLRPVRVLTRRDVRTLAAEAGLTVRSVEAEPGRRSSVSRDVWFLERRP